MNRARRKSSSPKRLIHGTLLFVFLSLQLSACSGSGGEKVRAIAQGKTLFQLHCCGCHGGRLSGLAKPPPNLAGIFSRPNLPSGAAATDAMVRSTILVGRSGIMPPFQGSLSDKQIEDIIQYLHTVAPGTPTCATK
jgi:mono/diheme cytochrome c family protein